MNVRYEGRIQLNIQVSDEDSELYILKMLLQPVVENAIKHGLREKNGEVVLCQDLVQVKMRFSSS